MKTKLILLLIVALFAGLLTGIWFIENKREIVVEVELDPKELVADGKSQITFHITVTNPDGSPRAGDELGLVRMKGYGQLKASRVKTDAEGKASIDYYSYRVGSYSPAVTNEIMVTDDSVGRIIGIKKRVLFDVPVVEPEKSDMQPGQKDKESHIQLGG
ncbi:Ig-like domain-containing protein [Paenibacillus nasutitermitis]|uniref:Big-1 domain-containing protein n=1 Tax=Paenibacillus nasutitermitis TaxID=1652958 RepID=A0A916Z1H1_9BACL|nr:hypothetical protein [Paenibacillus nasutitermitis]GGD72066.1 hypothetical protein GCM10010911_32480 [Paenibacillus nasutitermitis]